MKALAFILISFRVCFFMILPAVTWAVVLPRPVRFDRDSNGECAVAYFGAGTRNLRKSGISLFKMEGNEAISMPPEHSLESRFCERMYPRDPDQAFEEGFDVPAALLHISADELKATFKEDMTRTPLSYERRFRKRRTGLLIPKINDQSQPAQVVREIKDIDWQPIIQLNLDAANIWQALLECQPNAELARRAYFRGKKFCPDSAKDKEIYAKIRDYHLSVGIFLDSAKLIPDLKGAQVSSRFHPLFVQVLLEEYSRHLRFWFIDTTDISMQHQTKVGFLLAGGKDSPAAQQEYFWAKIDPSKLEESEFKYARNLVNILRLLNMVNDEQCTDWGLWPGATRTLMYLSQGLRYIESVMRDVVAKVNYACGDVSEDGASAYEVYYEPFTNKMAGNFRQLQIQYNSGARK